MNRAPIALVMAGGTGGHIFPGLAVAEALRAQGWQVHWIGNPQGMEAGLVAQRGLPFEPVHFSGVRGKGIRSLLGLPWRLWRACQASLAVMRRVQPDVVLGFGGYITVPAGLVALLRRTPLVLHEQNAVAGWANRLLAPWARVVATAFPGVFPSGEWVGNPLRAEFLDVDAPLPRYAARTGPLRVLVMGGSLGAKALNEVVPDAVALLPVNVRPVVVHQSGAPHVAALSARYADRSVQAETVAFIDNPATAMRDADLVICRAGASTVHEIAAIGVAALWVPYPHAVDDHQTANAKYLSDAGGGRLMPQSGLTASALAQILTATTRDVLSQWAQAAKQRSKTDATALLVRHCSAIVGLPVVDVNASGASVKQAGAEGKPT